jgi:hypothetical protein
MLKNKLYGRPLPTKNPCIRPALHRKKSHGNMANAMQIRIRGISNLARRLIHVIYCRYLMYSAILINKGNNDSLIVKLYAKLSFLS